MQRNVEPQLASYHPLSLYKAWFNVRDRSPFLVFSGERLNLVLKPPPSVQLSLSHFKTSSFFLPPVNVQVKGPVHVFLQGRMARSPKITATWWLVDNVSIVNANSDMSISMKAVLYFIVQMFQSMLWLA